MAINRNKDVSHWLADWALCSAHENGSALDEADIDAASLVGDDAPEPTDKQAEAIAVEATALLIGWRGPRGWMKQ